MSNGDEAARKATAGSAVPLAHSLYVRIVDVPEAKQPDKLSTAEIQEFSRVGQVQPFHLEEVRHPNVATVFRRLTL